MDEGAVELPRRHRQVPQVTQRGIAGTEFIHRDLHALVVQLGEFADAATQFDEVGFSQLQLEALRRQRMHTQGFVDAVQEAVSLQVLRGEVDAYAP